MSTLLHWAVGMFVLGGLVLGAACGQTGTPRPAASPTAPIAATSASGKPAQSTAPAAKPSVDPDWKIEWDRTLAAAKKEGKVVVAGAPGELFRNAAMAFQKVYPEIQIEFTGVSGRDFAPRLLAEREAGQYLWDVHHGGATTILSTLLPRGDVLDPLPPAFLLPEVTDSKNWIGGFDEGWADNARRYQYAFEGYLTRAAYVNRELVPESELNAIEQLVDSRWKGKILTGDPRVTGSTNGRFAEFLIAKGEDWVRRLLAQDLIIQRDERQAAEALVRGRYPISIGVDASHFEPFKREGLTANVVPLDPDGPAGSGMTTGWGNLVLINKAPHPNAAKVYINWLLSREGQKVYVESTGQNTRRVDVEGPPENRLKPGVKYATVHKEANLLQAQRSLELAKEIIK